VAGLPPQVAEHLGQPGGRAARTRHATRAARLRRPSRPPRRLRPFGLAIPSALHVFLCGGQPGAPPASCSPEPPPRQAPALLCPADQAIMASLTTSTGASRPKRADGACPGMQRQRAAWRQPALPARQIAGAGFGKWAVTTGVPSPAAHPGEAHGRAAGLTPRWKWVNDAMMRLHRRHRRDWALASGRPARVNAGAHQLTDRSAQITQRDPVLPDGAKAPGRRDGRRSRAARVACAGSRRGPANPADRGVCELVGVKDRHRPDQA